MTDFHLVDVFATAPYAGNQLAVVESFGDLDDEQMQAIAAEMDFSETTFVESVVGDADHGETRSAKPAVCIGGDTEWPTGLPTIPYTSIHRRRAASA